MRLVTNKTRQAFLNRKACKMGNTGTDGTALYLHGNKIAEWRKDGLWVTLAGWPTPTTRERLHGLPGVSVWQTKGKQFLNGEVWDGGWTKVA